MTVTVIEGGREKRLLATKPFADMEHVLQIFAQATDPKESIVKRQYLLGFLRGFRSIYARYGPPAAHEILELWLPQVQRGINKTNSED